jgi:OOP family OmpA-OmpF porin
MTDMPRYAKFLIGLAAALLAGWIGHGPLGQGELFISGLDARAQGEIEKAELNRVRVRFDRDPLRREAILSGQANEFQREGQGQLLGINGRIRAIPGVSGVRWEESGNAVAR